MSSHFTIDCTLKLCRNLAILDNLALNYLIFENVEIPKALPEHSFFNDGLPETTLSDAYDEFPIGVFTSTIWSSGEDAVGKIQEIVLRIPGMKAEDIFESFLPFANWLATLSVSEGYVGSIREEESDNLFGLIFVHERELYVDFEPRTKPLSVVTGRVRSDA